MRLAFQQEIACHGILRPSLVEFELFAFYLVLAYSLVKFKKMTFVNSTIEYGIPFREYVTDTVHKIEHIIGYIYLDLHWQIWLHYRWMTLRKRGLQTLDFYCQPIKIIPTMPKKLKGVVWWWQLIDICFAWHLQ